MQHSDKGAARPGSNKARQQLDHAAVRPVSGGSARPHGRLQENGTAGKGVPRADGRCTAFGGSTRVHTKLWR